MDPIHAMLAGVLDDVREQDAGDLAAYIPEWTVDGRRRRGQQLHDSVDVEAVRLRPRPRSARPERGVALRRSFVVDLSALTRLHPAARAVLREELDTVGGRIHVDG